MVAAARSHVQNKGLVTRQLLELCTAPLEQLRDRVYSSYSADAVCRVAHPVNELSGRLHRGLIAENWVPIDIIDILKQLGVDAFARMRHLISRPDLAL
jgi:hypothetical protein